MNIKKGYNIPSCLELKKSSIHGLGIFATKFIPKESNLGICHYYDYSESPVRHLRNPFVGFLNYSKDKNAHLPIVKKRFTNGIVRPAPIDIIINGDNALIITFQSYCLYSENTVESF